MTLTLRIENYDRLEDGGPAYCIVQHTGLQVGRGPMMDWVLPDPARHVSSHHFDVSFSQDAYWLADVSTNGTFLHGHSHRLDAPHRLADGDRLRVGHYIILVQLNSGAPAIPAAVDSAQSETDPWSLGPATFDPVDPSPRQDRRAAEDFGDSFIGSPVPPVVPPPAAMPAPTPTPPPPAVTPEPVTKAADSTLVAAFCKGAGIDPTGRSEVDAEALAFELGKSMRTAAKEIMAMLQDRSAAKQFTRSGERTMLGASENNPLKFLPDTEQALEALFLKPRQGFLTGEDGLGEALQDIRGHQAAVFAALQPALAQLLTDLAPEAVEAEVSKGSVLGGGRRSKSWELFVARWDAKTQAHENGMLDVFLIYFAEAYAKAVAGRN